MASLPATERRKLATIAFGPMIFPAKKGWGAPLQRQVPDKGILLPVAAALGVTTNKIRYKASRFLLFFYDSHT